MSLPVLFLLLALGFAGLLFAFTLVLQNYYSGQPTTLLPVRALVAGLAVGAFLTFWVYTNTRAAVKDQYGTLFEFRSSSSKPFEEFTAVRRHLEKDAEGKPRESRAKFVKTANRFIEGGDPTKIFTLNTANYLVVAIEIPEGDAKARFDAELFLPDEKKPGELRPAKPEEVNSTYARGALRVFNEANGRRVIEFSDLGTPGSIQAPNRGAWFGAVLLNIAHFAVWFIVFWPILRFTTGIALGLAAGFTAAVMFFLMPVLFDRVQAPPPPAPVALRCMPCWKANAV